MQSISKYIKRFHFSICVIDVYSKYAWVAPLKDKKGITITNAFQKYLDDSGCKPSKILADKGIEFYNTSIKSWLLDNDIEMYSTHNEGKLIVVKRYIRTLKNLRNKIDKYLISVLWCNVLLLWLNVTG